MRHLLAWLGLLLLGCGDDAVVQVDAPSCGEGIDLGGGRCIDPGLRKDDCSEGFAHDGDRGCNPVLPPAPCAAGELAVVGEEACRPLVPCGEAPWGDIPVDGSTQYVDAAFVGTSTGSATAPWPTVQDAIDAAAAGAIVAIAAGSYAGRVVVAGKPLRLWGRCPAMVEIAGGANDVSVVELTSADYELRGVAVTGAQFGVVMSGGGVVMDGVWIHHTRAFGLSLQSDLGAPVVHAKNVLIEQAVIGGAQVFGGELTLEQSAIRDVLPDAGGQSAGGLVGYPAGNAASSITVRRTLLERNAGLGLGAFGIRAVAEDIVVRDTQPGTSTGIGVAVMEYNAPASLTLAGSVVEGSLELGLVVRGANAHVERSVIRRTRTAGIGYGGGIGSESIAGTPSQLAVVQSLIDDNLGIGLRAQGTALSFDASVIRQTGFVEDGFPGRGMYLQVAPSGTAASLLMRASLVEASTSAGVLVLSAPATIESSLVRDTLPDVNGIADGVMLLTYQGVPATATLSNVTAVDNGRAALSLWGASAVLRGLRSSCNPIGVNGEAVTDSAFSVDDQGDNLCGCPDADSACEVLTLGLEFAWE